MARLASYRETLQHYLSHTWRLLNVRPVFLWAQAIAFKVLVSIVPVVILSTGVLGQVLRRERAFGDVAALVRAFLPAYRSDQLIAFLQQFADASGAVTAIGGFGLLFAAVTLMTTLRVVISSIFSEEGHIQRSVIKGYAFDLRMVVQVSVFFLLSMSLSLGMQGLNGAGIEWMEQAGLNYWWMREGWGRTFAVIGLLLPALLSLAVFFQLFLFIPKPQPPKRSALVGAAVASLLWELAKHVFAFYATWAGRFDRYDLAAGAPAEGDITVAVGSLFSLLLAFVFWIYYSGIVMIIGATIAFLHERRYRQHYKQRLSQARMERLRKDSTPKPPRPSKTSAVKIFSAEDSGVSAEDPNDPGA